MARSRTTTGPAAYTVREGFGVPGNGGFLRTYAVGAVIDGDDKLATTHRAYLDPVGAIVEAATADPGERRGLPLPSAVTARQAGVPRTTTITEETTVVHVLPPEHPDSPASVFAPSQPGAGVVADDADDAGQNLAGGPKASEADASGVVADDPKSSTAKSTPKK